MTKPIEVAAMLVVSKHNGESKLLFVRSFNSPYYGFPGGKLDAGETPDQALQRELREEVSVGAAGFRPVSTEHGVTPDGRSMTMYLYEGMLNGEPVASSEIELVEWMTYDEIVRHENEMTTMTIQCLPFIQARLNIS